MRLPKRLARNEDESDGSPGHVMRSVYTEMLVQVCRDYSSLPDPRTLTMGEIRFFYEGLRAELMQHTKPKK